MQVHTPNPMPWVPSLGVVLVVLVVVAAVVLGFALVIAVGKRRRRDGR